MAKPLSFQDLILRLHEYWSAQGCVILQPYDMEMGAGTFHPATTLRALGPKPWNAAYVQPCRRPTDGRYGENPNRLQHYYQYQVILKPSPADVQELYLGSYRAIGIDPPLHDIRFVEDDWESPTLGAWGLGWEVWCDGMEVGAVHLFPAGRRHRLRLAERARLTYGLERLAMYVQGVERVYDLDFNGAGRELWRRVPAGRAGIQPLQFRASRIPRCCHGISRMPRRECASLLQRQSWRCRPTTSASRPATCSTCSTRAA